MTREKIEPANYLFPMPVVLVGAEVDGKPNFMTAAFCGIVNIDPPSICVSIHPSHLTTRAVRENGVFSVNVPSADMVEAVDYCGLYSGHKVDKSAVFETRAGGLAKAPLIEDCPVSLCCEVVHELDLKPDIAIVGKIVEAWAKSECLEDGKPAMDKVNPLAFSMAGKDYWSIGERIAKAWSVGKDYKPGG